MEARSLTVFYLTDVHARIDAEKRGMNDALRVWIKDPPAQYQLGLAAVESTLLREMKVCKGPALFINCGDLVGVEKIHDLTEKGLVTLEAMEAMVTQAGIRHAVTVVGNHELDFGISGLNELRKSARILPFLSANLKIDGHPISSPFQILTMDGLRVAVMALTVDRAMLDAHTDDQSRMDHSQPTEMAKSILAELRRKKADGEVDIVIAAVHLEDDDDKEIAAIDGIDLLLGGHSHTFHHTRMGATHYRKVGCYAQALGVVQFDLHPSYIDIARSQFVLVGGDDLESAQARQVLQRAQSESRAKNPALYEPIAEISEPMLAGEAMRRSERPLGRLVAQVIREIAYQHIKSWVHFSFINSGNIRDDLAPVGRPVQPVDLHGVVPYRNEIFLVEAAPEVVMRVLYNFVGCAKFERPGFLQFDGIQLRVAANGMVHEVRVATGPSTWAPLESLSRLRFATINYLVAEKGGHHYQFLSDETVIRTGVRIVDGWEQLLRNAATIRLPLLQPPPTKCLHLSDDFYNTPSSTIANTIVDQTGDALAWICTHR